MLADDLSAYIDAELDAGRAAQIERHLEQCADCRATVGELRRIAAGVAALPRYMAPATLADDVGRAVRQASIANGRAARTWVGVRIAVRVLAAAALVVFGVILDRVTLRAPEDETRELLRPAAPLVESGRGPARVRSIVPTDTTGAPDSAGLGDQPRADARVHAEREVRLGVELQDQLQAGQSAPPADTSALALRAEPQPELRLKHAKPEEGAVTGYADVPRADTGERASEDVITLTQLSDVTVTVAPQTTEEYQRVLSLLPEAAAPHVSAALQRPEASKVDSLVAAEPVSNAAAPAAAPDVTGGEKFREGGAASGQLVLRDPVDDARIAALAVAPDRVLRLIGAVEALAPHKVTVELRFAGPLDAVHSAGFSFEPDSPAGGEASDADRASDPADAGTRSQPGAREATRRIAGEAPRPESRNEPVQVDAEGPGSPPGNGDKVVPARGGWRGAASGGAGAGAGESARSGAAAAASVDDHGVTQTRMGRRVESQPTFDQSAARLGDSRMRFGEAPRTQPAAGAPADRDRLLSADDALRTEADGDGFAGAAEPDSRGMGLARERKRTGADQRYGAASGGAGAGLAGADRQPRDAPDRQGGSPGQERKNALAKERSEPSGAARAGRTDAARDQPAGQAHGEAAADRLHWRDAGEAGARGDGSRDDLLRAANVAGAEGGGGGRRGFAGTRDDDSGALVARDGVPASQPSGGTPDLVQSLVGRRPRALEEPGAGESGRGTPRAGEGPASGTTTAARPTTTKATQGREVRRVPVRIRVLPPPTTAPASQAAPR